MSLLGVAILTSACLLGVLIAFLIFIFILFSLPVLSAVIIGIVALGLQFLVAPFLTDLSMKWFYKAKFKNEMPPYLVNFVNELCKKYNMKYPKFGFIDDSSPNAFTYGRTKNDARIVLTKGIFEMLSEEEVKAVVAHEMGHVVHYDMFFMTALNLIPLVLYALYLAFKDNDSDNKNSQYTQIISVIAYVLYVISEYVILFLSRTREYYADSFSIEETKNPSALANSLVKIGYGLSTKSSNKKSNSNALGIFDSKSSKAFAVNVVNGNASFKEKIKNAMKWDQWNLWAKYYELHSTHPLISKRLLAISEKCPAYNQEPYIVFDLAKPESYVDDFVKEVIIYILPTVLLFAGILIGCLTESLIVGEVIVLFAAISSYIKFKFKYRDNDFKSTTISDLLGEVKVSNITAIPCTLSGTIIGKGDPGCIFNEDFTLRDSTGIIFLDYKQPINIANTIFALFKSKKYIDKQVVVEGWYRRSPVPYVEIKQMNIDGKIKKCRTYSFNKFGSILMILIVVMAILITIA